MLHFAFTVDRRCFLPKNWSVASLTTSSGENLHKVPVWAKKGDSWLNFSLHFWSCLVATSTQPSLCLLNLWVTVITLAALAALTITVTLVSNVCCNSVPQVPPRRPAVYAEQHENDEEKQFRRVFQQLAGDVSAMSTCTSLWIFIYILTAMVF